MAVLVHQGEQLPVTARSVFTTVHDNQTEVPTSNEPYSVVGMYTRSHCHPSV